MATDDAGGHGRWRPHVRFNAIGEAWGLFWEQPGTWIVTGLIVLLGNWMVSGAVFAAFGEGAPGGAGGFRVALPPAGQWLDVVLSAVVNGFFLGGMFRMACLQVRGRPVSVGDLFGITDVLPDLIVGSVLYGLACFAAGLVCFVIPAFIVAGVLMFTLPLIVDGRLKAVEAIRQSWHALKREWLTATVFHFVTNVITGLGVCCFCVGLLFTMPLYCLSIAALYRDFFLTETSDDFAKPVAPDPDF